MRKFKHSGLSGDLIYGLCAVKAMGGGEILLSREPAFPGQVLTDDAIASLEPLLKAQPYISGVRMYQGERQVVDLDVFRDTLTEKDNLADRHLVPFGLDRRFRDGPWLMVSDPVRVDGRPVVLHRTPRYQDACFPWQEVIATYRDVASFIGFPDEYRAFVAQFGPIPYVPTRDLLEVARIIAGSGLFIGNQSSPYAIAEGLKVHTIQETAPGYPNCIFQRPNAQHGPNALLPSVEDLEARIESWL